MLQFFRLNSIRVRIFSGFLFLTLLILLLTVASLLMLYKAGQIGRIYTKINQLQVLTLSLIKTDNDFFDIGTSSEDYFKHRKSPFLDVRDSLLSKVETGLRQIEENIKDEGYPIDNYLVDIDTIFTIYNSKFNELENLIFSRGFRDYGLEGKMRVHAHALENSSLGVKLTSTLSLRRFEKDFLLRHDTAYVITLNQLAEKLVSELKKDSMQYAVALFHLREYKRLFNELVIIEGKIGMNSLEGLRNELNQRTTALSQKYFTLAEFSRTYAQSAQQKIRIFYIAMMVGAIIITIVSGFWISKRLAGPIARLSSLMEKIIGGSKRIKISSNLSNAAYEINLLTGTFVKLVDQVNSQMKEIEKKSRLLKRRNLELRKVNRELDSFLYSTAHDLRSPLSSLLGLIRLAERENRQPELTSYFKMMRDSIVRQEEFIKQIVSYSKNKKLDLNIEQVDLKKLIEETLESHRFMDGTESITQLVEVKEECEFYSDKSRLAILLNNLVSNGIRYRDTNKTNPFIRISAHIRKEEAYIELADNGIGIGPEHIERIFEIFYRASVVSKGSGLGLFIFKETLLKLKGLVSVESTIGVGTKFMMTIPNWYLQQTSQLTFSEFSSSEN